MIVSSHVCAALDQAGAAINVTKIAPPTLTVSPSATVCYGSSLTLTATGCQGGTVTWQDGSIGQQIQKTVYSDQWISATCTVNGCTSASSERIHVTLGTSTIPTIVAHTSAICTSETISLTATGCAGSYVWSDPASTTGSVLTVSPTTTTSYRVKCLVGQCEGEWSAYNTIQVGAPAAPAIALASVGTSATVCLGTSVTLVATGCPATGSITWSTGQIGQAIVVSPTTSATYTARCGNSATCISGLSNPVMVTVLSTVPKPVVVDKTNTCPFKTVDLTTAVAGQPTTSGGQFTFYTNASLSTPVANPAAVGAGTYYVVEKTTSGCYSEPAAIHVQITTCEEPTPCDTANPATANAGADASVCLTKSYQLHGAMGGAGKLAHWTTSGSGTFDNPYSLSAIYTASAQDIQMGQVTLTLSVSTNNASCPVATDNMVLTIDGIKTVPVITIQGSRNLCYGDSVVLSAPAGADGYKWSDGETKQQIVVKQSGTYSVVLFDSKGCSSVESASVTVQVANPVLPPLVTNLRNTCPSKIVDLTKALSTTTAGSSYIYRICECVTSNIVIRPDSVCEGTYWIVEKTAQGCVSAPVKVEVKVFNCLTDTLDTDVRLVKSVSSTVTNGLPVTYTLTVSNAGPHTAKNIDVRDVVPSGLQLILGASPGFTVTNGVITKRIDSLKAGDSTQIVFTARVVKKGEVIVNTAQITYLDNHDPDLTNNTSSVSVKDTATARGNLPDALLGVAKSVGTPILVETGVFDIPYTIMVSNMGSVPLTKVQVVDNLSQTFGHGAVIVNNRIPVTTDAGLTADTLYTGQGLITTMLIDSLSSLPVGVSRNLNFTVRVDVRHADSLTFYNTAYATALAANNVTVADTSTSGTNPDPKNTLDPRDSNLPTAVSLNGLSASSYIGVAMSVRDTVRQADGSFNVTYQIVVKAYGPDTLKNVSIADTLSQVFNSQTGSSYRIVSAPIITSTGSALNLNPNFNGGTDPVIVLGDSISTLASGKVDTIQVVVNVASTGSTTTFLNSAYAQAVALSGTVSDVSTSGLNPDLNGNGNPTDSNEREATALNLPPIYQVIFIPEGFSPNGDGVNDLFVIRGTVGLTVSLDVYNRWGNRVYTNSDYRNDWDGKPNTGIALSSDATGVPDGTYYYVITLSDGRKFVRYMTINR
ncbi:gliding motility-associated C-terminal domain-containing protein [Spirosoma telluris]|uniref:T9SS type B sorting domain-containing protein n=1 Tax=Spirosoma telluris TaxID=2183553 RepID=UPI002FC2E15B